MILLLDISANQQDSLESQIEKIITLTQNRDGECFVARSAEINPASCLRLVSASCHALSTLSSSDRV
jgi:hypothetical protein